jgi:hypothetical protein
MIKLTVTGGRAWEVFKGEQGRVRRSLSARGSREAFLSSKLWQQLGEYAIWVIRLRLTQGIGSNDQPMPPLKRPRNAKYIDAGYPGLKRRLGLQPIRDLYGPGGVVSYTSKTTGKKRYLRSGTAGTRTHDPRLSGKRGHMLDDMRVNAVTESGVSIDIGNRASRTKARANQERAAWCGFSRSDRAKITAKARELLGVEILDWSDVFGALGLIASRKFGSAARGIVRRAA